MPPALDTLQIAKRLKEAGFTEPQAEAVTTVLRDAREADFSLLATKADLNGLRDAIKADNDRLHAELETGSNRLHVELETGSNRLHVELEALRKELDAKLEAFRKEIDAKLEILRRDLTIRLGSMIVIATGVLLAAKFFG